MHASLLGFCHESLILSDDLIGQALRCVRGIEVDDETLALDQMREVCMGGPDKPGVGHYLGTDRTLSHMERDCVYPALGNRMSTFQNPSPRVMRGMDLGLKYLAFRRTRNGSTANSSAHTRGA